MRCGILRGVVLLFISFPVLAGAFQLDWSGDYKARAAYARGEMTLKSNEKDNNKAPFGFYGRQQLVLNSKALVSDGLSVQTNFLLGSATSLSKNKADEKDATKHTHPHQTTFTGSSRNQARVQSSALQDILLVPTHFYVTYSNEFLQMDMGRQPFSFGIGLTYSDGVGPFFFPVYDVRDAVSVKVQYEPFYVKPYFIIHNQDEFSGTGVAFAAAAGYETDNITAEVLYKSKNYVMQKTENPDFKSKPLIDEQTLNVHGKYKEGPLTAQVEWGFMANDMKKSAALGTVSWKTDFYNTSFNVIGGYISDYDMNPNVDYTGLLSGYHYHINDISKPEDVGLFPRNVFVVAPYVTFDLTEKHSVLVLHAWLSDQDTLNLKAHDLGVVATHKIKKNFSWSNTFIGLMQGFGISDFYLRTQAVLSF